MNKLTHLIKLVTITAMVAINSSSWAGCSVTSPVSQDAGNIPTSFTFTASQTTGSKIGGEINVADSSIAYGYSCNAKHYALLQLNTSWTLTNIPGVYQTSIPGIGIKIVEASIYGNISYLKNSTQVWYSPGGAVSNGGAFVTGLKVQFYQIGPLTPGIYPAEIMAEAWMNTANTTVGGANYVTLKLPEITIKAPSCETPNIKVDLGKHKSSEFSSLYSTSATTPFNFEIKNCTTDTSSISFTFKPATGITLQQAGTLNQYLKLSADSSATGVGIQVLYDSGAIVPFNSKVTYAGYNAGAGGSYIIPMKALYIKTASTMTGGTANSAVEFTMSYE